MKIVTINLNNIGSTGKIVYSISDLCSALGIQMYHFYPSVSTNAPKRSNDIIVGNEFLRKIERRICMLTGKLDSLSIVSTLFVLWKIKRINPDIIHLHNIHNNYINHRMLFRFIQKNRIKVVWTLHDCWSFTGKCTHFTMEKCMKWKTGCNHCTQYKKYPEAYVDSTKSLWKKKSKLFNSVDTMVLVTPSKWLEKLVLDSFLSKYPVRVINNGINLSVFKPCSDDSIFEKYGINKSKKIVLGVAFGWKKEKGDEYFFKLNSDLPSDYQIVLVGKNSGNFPNGIVSIERTYDQIELAKIYSLASVLVNPTREEVLGMVNIEALACGTPVITFNSGGSSEMISSKCGIVIQDGDYNSLLEAVISVCTGDITFNKTDCVNQAHSFNELEKYKEYLSLYKELDSK